MQYYIEDLLILFLPQRKVKTWKQFHRQTWKLPNFSRFKQDFLSFVCIPIDFNHVKFVQFYCRSLVNDVAVVSTTAATEGYSNKAYLRNETKNEEKTTTSVARNGFHPVMLF